MRDGNLYIDKHKNKWILRWDNNFGIWRVWNSTMGWGLWDNGNGLYQSN